MSWELLAQFNEAHKAPSKTPLETGNPARSLRFTRTRARPHRTRPAHTRTSAPTLHTHPIRVPVPPLSQKMK